MRSPAVDRYIFELKENEQLVFEILRDFIFNKITDVEECIKWNCPFYSYHGLLCYINYDKKSRKVVLGFIEGFLIEDEFKLFSEDTKQIKKIFFANADDLDEEILHYYLDEAIAINKAKTRNFLLNRKRK